jgi:hypothetical protein
MCQYSHQLKSRNADLASAPPQDPDASSLHIYVITMDYLTPVYENDVVDDSFKRSIDKSITLIKSTESVDFYIVCIPKSNDRQSIDFRGV